VKGGGNILHAAEKKESLLIYYNLQTNLYIWQSLLILRSATTLPNQ